MDSLLSCLQAVYSTAQRVEHENRLVNQYTARDFTPFQFMAWSEVPSTHMLAFFLNPDEDHGQGTLFQDIFLDHLRQLPLVGPRLPRTRWRVEAERRHGELGQIDLLLTAADRRFAICIENKPRDQTADQYQQLTRYRQVLQERHHDNYLLLYLSRAPRPPHEDSLAVVLREELQKSGHYANITYESFIRPLVEAWQQDVYPEALRTFLQQFRYQIEQWLAFPTTKPSRLMQAEEIATTLVDSSAYVHTAFDIASSLDALKRKLREKLVQQLADPANGLVGEEHWDWKGFLAGENTRPYLIRRVTTGPEPQRWPWGRFSICMELDDERLYYGIRFDIEHWHAENTTYAAWPEGTPAQLAEQFAGEPGGRPTEWWPWWRWAGPETEQNLYTAIADGTLIKELQQEVQRLVLVLDRVTASTTLEANN